MARSYSKSLEIRWADIDPNGHLRHPAYADYVTRVRVRFPFENGFSLERLAALRIGPVLFREELSYLKDVRSHDRLSVDLRLAGLAPDGSRWRFLHEIVRESDGVTVARVVVDWAWLDLDRRRLTRPSRELMLLLDGLQHGEQFEPLRALS